MKRKKGLIREVYSWTNGDPEHKNTLKRSRSEKVNRCNNWSVDSIDLIQVGCLARLVLSRKQEDGDRGLGKRLFPEAEPADRLLQGLASQLIQRRDNVGSRRYRIKS